MISRDELTKIALKKGFKDLKIIEKDYALTWALKAIYSNEKLSKFLVFKGGTCLSKVYSETYRLSEDLDFSGYREGKLDFEELEAELDRAFEDANKDGAPSLSIKKDDTHSNEGYIAFRVRYVGPLAHPANIKIELKVNEFVLMDSVSLPVLEAAYPDIKPFKIRCYHFFELFTEKVRATIQRGKSRDYYDVWQMLTNKTLRKNLPDGVAGIRKDLHTKCVRNGIEYAPEMIFDKENLQEAKMHWKDSLGYLVKDLPDFEKVVSALREELFEESELSAFAEDFDVSHIRNIAREPRNGVLIIRAVELVSKRLDSKKVKDVETALSAIPKIHGLLKKNEGWAIAMQRSWKEKLEVLSEDKDDGIAGAAKSYLNILNQKSAGS